MDIQLKTGCFDDAALVRRVVFMDEQGYENEFDAIDEDPNCIHVTLYGARVMPAPSSLSCMRRNTCCRSMPRRVTRRLPRWTTKTRASPMFGWPSA